MTRTFYTIYSWIVFCLGTFIFGLVGIFFAILRDYPRVMKYCIRPWSYWPLRAAGVKVRVTGIENLPKEPSIIMYNHQSSIDILAFGAYLPIEWKAVIKDQLALVPFIGWVAKLSGHYFVARDGSIKDTNEVKKIVKEIRSGPSVLIAPEGTRSKDGKLLPFKKGGFVIAMLARVPVVPMVIQGGREIMSKNAFMVKHGKMDIKILTPINVANLPQGKVGRDKLEKMVRESMENVLGGDEKLKIAS